jgi:hypothetical protein
MIKSLFIGGRRDGGRVAVPVDCDRYAMPVPAALTIQVMQRPENLRCELEVEHYERVPLIGGLHVFAPPGTTLEEASIHLIDGYNPQLAWENADLRKRLDEAARTNLQLLIKVATLQAAQDEL